MTDVWQTGGTYISAYRHDGNNNGRMYILCMFVGLVLDSEVLGE